MEDIGGIDELCVCVYSFDDFANVAYRDTFKNDFRN